jgi:hypothetical protein
MLRVLDAMLKARARGNWTSCGWADDLGGKALAVLDGELYDVQEAVEISGELSLPTKASLLLGASITARTG